MSARVGGVHSGWFLNQEPVGGLRSGSRIHPNRLGRGADAGSAGFVGPPRHCGSVVRTVGGPDVTPSSADRTPHGLDESRSAGRGRSELTWLDGSPQLPSGSAH